MTFFSLINQFFFLTITYLKPLTLVFDWPLSLSEVASYYFDLNSGYQWGWAWGYIEAKFSGGDKDAFLAILGAGISSTSGTWRIQTPPTTPNYLSLSPSSWLMIRLSAAPYAKPCDMTSFYPTSTPTHARLAVTSLAQTLQTAAAPTA